MEAIAIVGFSFRFPQDADDVNGFWDIILNGKSTMTEVPKNRWDINGYYSHDQSKLDSLPCRGGHFMRNDVAKFDAAFFSMNESEAKAMDPQLRGLLEVTFCALENAGIKLDGVRGSKTSVFVGNISSDYERLYGHDEEIQSPYKATGVSNAMLSNRLSWFYDLRGPSMTVDTACSSSLVALHLACQNIRVGESNMSLVCGSNLYFDPRASAIPLSNQGFLSQNSTSKSFDEAADGYSKGEGLAVIVLKRVSEALRDGDTIRAVIRGTGANQDGRTPSIAQHNPEAQADLIRRVYNDFDIDPGVTRYFEAHGTGTTVGDPIEADAIQRVFGCYRSRADPLYIGSTKANIGHLGATSGLAGMIKTVLVLEKGIIPPIALLENLNKKIDPSWSLEFPTAPLPWPGVGVRRASVNAFGYGGANAHIVIDDGRSFLLEHAPFKLIDTFDAPVSKHLLVWSTADASGFGRLACQLSRNVSGKCTEDQSEYLHDLAYTLSERRTLFPWRSFALAENCTDLQENIIHSLLKPMRSSTAPNIHFIFTGQGAQWAGMGMELLRYPIFESSMHAADVHFRALGSSWSLIDELRALNSSRINDPEIAQPACTALQVALVDLLADWNIHPHSVVGHSSGEVAAAYSAGSISKESAWTIAYFRGSIACRPQSTTSGCQGAMMTVALSVTELRPYLEEYTKRPKDCHGVSVGCINSPRNTTLTGSAVSIEALKKRLDENQVFTRKLNIPVAYHSIHMLQFVHQYRESLKGAISYDDARQHPISTLFSSVTGQPLSSEELLDPEYWVRNLLSPVVFEDAIRRLRNDANDRTGHGASSKAINCLIEVGPHPALQRCVLDIFHETPDLEYHRSLRRNTPAVSSLKELGGSLFMRGYPVDVKKINQENSRRHPRLLTDLPAYSFNHSQSYWLESRLSRNRRFRKLRRHELVGRPSDDWNSHEAKWRFTIRVREHEWVKHHVVSTAPGGKQQPSWAYRIYVLEQEDFRLISSGCILIELADPSDIVASSSAKDKTRQKYKTLYKRALAECTNPFSSNEFYETLKALGARFGPSFRNLQHIFFDNGGSQAIASMKLDHWRTTFPTVQIEEHVIHPTALDVLFQLPYAAMSKGSEHAVPLMIPTKVEHVWISHDLLSIPNEVGLSLYARTIRREIREVEFITELLNTRTWEPLISFKSFRLAAVNSPSSTPTSTNEIRRLCYRFDWKPDISLVGGEQIMEYCRAATEKLDNPVDPVDDEVCLYFLSQAIEQLESVGFQPGSLHLRKYVEWAKDFLNKPQAQDTSGLKRLKGLSEVDIDDFLHTYAAGSPSRGAYLRFGQNLPLILRGHIDALHLLFNEGLAAEIYNGPVFSYSIRRLTAYLDLLAHKDSSLDILEVGAGTGSGTKHILHTLSLHGEWESKTPRYNTYHFSDISPSFFEDARVQFETHADRMQFKLLDIERTPFDQGFSHAQYDVIVGVSVLHATKSIDETLHNLKSLLKPGGHLLLTEPTNIRSVVIPFVSGVLAGWWRSSVSHNALSPLYTRDEWNDALIRTGFTGLEVFLSDESNDTHHVFSFIASKACNIEKRASDLPPVIVVAGETSLQQRISAHVQSSLLEYGFMDCRITDFNSLSDLNLSGFACISLLEFERSFLTGMSEQSYTTLRRLFGTANHLIWVTGGGGEQASRPEADVISGLGKTTSIERPELKFCHLDVQEDLIIPPSVAELLLGSITQDARNCEIDVVENRGLLYIPRVVEAVDINAMYWAAFGRKNPALTFVTPGQLGSIHYIAHDTFDSSIECGEVIVEVKATEFAGVVSQASPDTLIQIGARVCGIVRGSFKSHVRIHERNLIEIPKAVNFVEAASIPVAFTTAQYGLVHLARLRRGESILIHAAAGAVGQAAIQIAQKHGADIYVTVSSDRKKKLLMDKYHLEDTHFFSSRNSSFPQHIMDATKGRGIDVVLNSLAGGGLTETWRCMAPLGRFIEIGKRDIDAFAHLPMAPFSKNVTFSSLDIATVYQHDVRLMGQLMEEIECMLSTTPPEISTPYPLRVFKRSEFEGAFRSLQTGMNSGKAVVDWAVEDNIRIIPKSVHKYKFDLDATYIISGGLGGIGRSIARWMAERGAKNLILLSRTGAGTSKACALLNELKERGVRVEAPPCDISDQSALSTVLAHCERIMPHIKGCIQASMVINNSKFDRMTLHDFNAALPSKISGTWNLHHLLPSGMDFFILLASLAGVHGASAQANYAAACSFQDAFARYRHSLGERCTSLDLGVVSSVGYIAERIDVAKKLTLSYTGHDQMDERDLDFVVEQAITNPTPKSSTGWDTQVLAAMTTPAMVKKSGLLEEHAWMQKPSFRHLYQIDKGHNSIYGTPWAKTNYEQLLQSSCDLKEAGDVIASALIQRLSRSLSVLEEDIDAHKPAHAFGVDSLVAVELKFWFQNEIKANLTILQILGGSSIQELGNLAAEKSEYCSKAWDNV
ncbi:ketoacyl-synt-domain-containing protein [Lindgomyces ingoldianus]|uniref:Ketoacyl-synt-domain-containing protein n=1 Tax=Lindgomyces ingoldianus TaxID=673940 RepID=A0ACB6QBA2_9PLEO|nr:ketoacyl-synt-domain-containing protein [Lindgomyces ingoldianus]KAF2463868.1 ketoacyl-synt-domain-containing protein [Lindgomyces ingoldianus]